MSERTGPAPLTAAARVLCLLGPLLCLVLFALARAALPFVWSHPLLARLVGSTCVFRGVTGLPCPFCGGTRAVFLAAHGRWSAAVMMNPLGAVVVALAPLVGVWLGACAATGRDLGLRTMGRLLSSRRTVCALLFLLAGLWAFQIWVARGVVAEQTPGQSTPQAARPP